MRRVRYQVACSLDGFIAGTRDDFDWIIPEPAFNFETHFAQFDTLLMGRRTYEIARSIEGSFIGKKSDRCFTIASAARSSECGGYR